MNIEEVRAYCLSLPKVEENSPWTDPRYCNLITYSVAEKWFCLLNIDNKCCNIKCPPQQVLELQDQYAGIRPAWHMNKKHWVTMHLDSDLPDEKIQELLRQAYTLIANSLPKSKRLAFGL
ncbi:MAG: MmcQ/YjbR family DNA-binding protein [Duncaniella sp.]|nr:MmcQ/YjbR family DNA-binding protein [Duncaniella sp.]